VIGFIAVEKGYREEDVEKNLRGSPLWGWRRQ